MEKEIIGLEQIVFYPQEIYALHYKNKPFSISYISYEEQRKRGIQYTRSKASIRKVYFTKGHAITGIKNLPKYLQDKVEIVKYVPATQMKNNDFPLFKI